MFILCSHVFNTFFLHKIYNHNGNRPSTAVNQSCATIKYCCNQCNNPAASKCYSGVYTSQERKCHCRRYLKEKFNIATRNYISSVTSTTFTEVEHFYKEVVGGYHQPFWCVGRGCCFIHTSVSVTVIAAINSRLLAFIQSHTNLGLPILDFQLNGQPQLEAYDTVPLKYTSGFHWIRLPLSTPNPAPSDIKGPSTTCFDDESGLLESLVNSLAACTSSVPPIFKCCNNKFQGYNKRAASPKVFKLIIYTIKSKLVYLYYWDKIRTNPTLPL